MEHGFGHWAASDHVHVNGCFDAVGKLRSGIEQRHSALNFWRPDKADGPSRPRQLAFRDQLLQCARDFQDSHAAAGVVICSGTLMVEVATVNNFFVFEFGIGAQDCCGDTFGISWMLSGANCGVEEHLFAMRPTFAPRGGGLPRYQGSECPGHWRMMRM